MNQSGVIAVQRHGADNCGNDTGVPIRETRREVVGGGASEVKKQKSLLIGRQK